MSEDVENQAIPPGIRIHLKETEEYLRHSGISCEPVDAYFDARSMLTLPILRQHRDLRRSVRRELKRTLEKTYLAGVEHLQECDRCRAWFAAIHREFASILATSEKPRSK